MTPSGKIGADGHDDSGAVNPAKATEDAQSNGGSSFEHLTEGNGTDHVIYSDWTIIATHDPDAWFGDGNVPGVDIDPVVGALDVFTAVTGTGALLVYSVDGTTTNFVFRIEHDGTMAWSTGIGNFPPDTHLSRADTGVLQIEEAGGGLRLKSPDGLSTKTLQLNNDGVTLDLV